jgi:hypothetical protein
MRYGSKPVDKGYYLFTQQEKDAFLRTEPGAEKLFRRITGSYELINGISRWCLWLADADPAELRKLPKVVDRVVQVRAMRLDSEKESTRRAASTPTLFTEMRQPAEDYLAVPEVSSENREYIPVAFLASDVIVDNKAYAIAGATLYHFGIFTSRMHMAWVRAVCGRLKSDYRYSAGIVYNNFPWPEDVTETQRAEIERLAQAVLDARALFPNSTLADLYDPNTMPPELTRAHHALDRAVDHLYRRQPFPSDLERVEHLFTEYQRMISVQAK